MTTTSALQQAVALVNQGDALDVADWVEIVQASRAVLATRGEPDTAVEYAMAVSWLMDAEGRANDIVGPLVDSLRRTPAVSTSQVRTVVAMVTHAARRNALTNPVAALLEGVERAALRRVPIPQELDEMESALSRWSSVVAAVGRNATPQVAAAIGRQQAGLLQLTRRLVSRMSPGPAAELGANRLIVQLDESSARWRQSITGWTRSSERSALSMQDMTGLSMAAVELRTALTGRAATGETLMALLRSGVAGNLLVAAALTPDPASRLVASAEQLESVVVRIIDANRPVELVSTPADDTVAGTSAQPRPAAPPVMSSAVEVPSVEAVELTPYLERELAARRDIGVIAHAALSGIPAAKGLLPHASQAELSDLAADGRHAVGVLVASVQPAIWSRVRRFHGELDERFAVGAVAVAAAAHRWDPRRSRWLSYSLKVSEWAQAGYFRDYARLPVPVDMNVDSRHRADERVIDPRYLVGESPDPAAVAVVAVDGHRAAELVGRLPWPSNQILREAMGFGPSGQPVALEAISRRLDMPSTTVRRHMRRGLARVQAQLGVEH